MRYKSERLRDEAEKLIKSRENKTVHTQQASNQKLNNRLHDVVLFRSELEVILLSIYDFCFLFVTIKIMILCYILETKIIHIHTFFFKNEINRNKRETADLKETRRLLQKAIKETDGPLKVTSECLFHREGRRVRSFHNLLPFYS